MSAEALRRADPVTTLQLDLGRPEPKPVKQFLAGLGVFLVAQVASAIVLAAGPLLNAAYLLTRRLWLPIGIHLAWNAAQSALFGIDVSGSGSGRGLFESELRGAEWLSGGSMGIEGSIVLVAIGTAFGVGLTVLAHRRGRMLPGHGRQEAVPAPSAAGPSA